MNGDHSHRPTAHNSPSLTIGEIPGDGQSESESSYASYDIDHHTDRSVVLLSSDGPETLCGRRSPFAATSSRQHSLYQTRGGGSGVTPIRLLNDTEGPQPPSGPDERISSPPTNRSVQVLDHPAGTENDSTNPANNTVTPSNGPAPPPNDGPAYDNPAPPTVDMRDASVPPPRRVRARGVFIIGNGAPIRIDESIEVRLKDGVGGQVDFII